MTRRLWLRSSILLAVLGYVLRSPGLLLIGGMLATVYAAAWLLNRGVLRNLTYSRRWQHRRAFAGETLECEIRLENRRRLPVLWLSTSDAWPQALAPLDSRDLAPSHILEQQDLTLALSLPGRSRARRSYTSPMRQRGIYSVGPARAVSTDPFALFRAEAEIAPADRMVVYPPVRPLAELGFRSDDPLGLRRAQRRLFDDPSQAMGIRDYLPDDSFRHIHWPATARIGRLQTRVYQPVAGLDMVVCLNAATFDRPWEGYEPERMEALVEVTAAIVNHAVDSGYGVGLISNGSIARSGRPFRIAPSRDRRQLSLLLECLAGLTPIVKAPFASFLLAEAPHLPYGATLIVVTALTSPAILEALVRLHAHNRRTRLVSLADAPPPILAGIDTTHIRPGQRITA